MEGFLIMMAVFMKVNGSMELWMDMVNFIILAVNWLMKVSENKTLSTGMEKFSMRSLVIELLLMITGISTCWLMIGKDMKANSLKTTRKDRAYYI